MDYALWGNILDLFVPLLETLKALESYIYIIWRENQLK